MRPGIAVGVVPVPARHRTAAVFVVVQSVAVIVGPALDVVDFKIETEDFVPVRPRQSRLLQQGASGGISSTVGRRMRRWPAYQKVQSACAVGGGTTRVVVGVSGLTVTVTVIVSGAKSKVP